MIDALTMKSASGDLYVNLAKLHLSNHEWGLARRAVESGLEKGELSDFAEARRLLGEIISLLSRE